MHINLAFLFVFYWLSIFSCLGYGFFISRLFKNTVYFKNYGYPVAGKMKGKTGLISITYGGPMVSYCNFSVFDNIPYRRIKKSVFQLGGLKARYLRFYSVLPDMPRHVFDAHMARVRGFAKKNLK